MSSTQHLSDEAVAAAADGVLSGHARERASRHVAGCAECAEAIRVQREAAWALRTAQPPSLPYGLLERLRTVGGDVTLPAPWPDGRTETYLPLASPIAAIVPGPGTHAPADDDASVPARRRPSFPTGLFRSGGR